MCRAMIGFVHDVVAIRYFEIDQFQQEQRKNDE